MALHACLNHLWYDEARSNLREGKIVDFWQQTQHFHSNMDNAYKFQLLSPPHLPTTSPVDKHQHRRGKTPRLLQIHTNRLLAFPTRTEQT
jgi:hypothetical protein